MTRALLYLCLAAALWSAPVVSPAVAAAGVCEKDCGGEDPPPPEDPPAPPPEPGVFSSLGGEAGEATEPPPRNGGGVMAPGGRPEYLISGTGGDVAAAQTIITGLGGTILRQSTLPALDRAMVAIDPGGADADGLRAELARAGLAVTVDRNATYRLAATTLDYAGDMLRIDGASGCPLPDGFRIGLVDGPVDTVAPMLSGVRVDTRVFLPESAEPAPSHHGTAIAELLAGPVEAPEGRREHPLILSAVAFGDEGAGVLARTDDLALALDWLASERARVVNLSLAGPPNRVLGEVIAGVAARGMVLVAAAGNDSAGVAYPASDPNVLAITAVDARSRPYQKANRGREIDFAAPGVDIRLHGPEGTTFRSGTSYAAALGAAVVAHHMAGPDGAAPLYDRLRASARDLGAAGHDRTFGWGLLQSPTCP